VRRDEVEKTAVGRKQKAEAREAKEVPWKISDLIY
jgi:hypothetical protein